MIEGVIGPVVEAGFPVVYRSIDEAPSEQKRAALQWPTVIAWSADRAVRNGMPPEDVNARMIQLEESISDDVEAPGSCEPTRSSTVPAPELTAMVPNGRRRTVPLAVCAWRRAGRCSSGRAGRHP